LGFVLGCGTRRGWRHWEAVGRPRWSGASVQALNLPTVETNTRKQKNETKNEKNM
jgi:hypothetical protein